MPMTLDQQEEIARVGGAVKKLVEHFLDGSFSDFTPTAKALILAYAQVELVLATQVAGGLSPEAAREATKATLVKLIDFAMEWIKETD